MAKKAEETPVETPVAAPDDDVDQAEESTASEQETVDESAPEIAADDADSDEEFESEADDDADDDSEDDPEPPKVERIRELSFQDGVTPSNEPGGTPASVEEALMILGNLLFVSSQPITGGRLQTLLGGVTTECLNGLMRELEIRVKLLGLELRQFGGGWQIGTQPDYAEWVFKLSRRREKTGLSPQALETLAIVAYKQPITKGEVDTIRGIDSGNQIRHLVEIELLEIRGRKDVPGRPMLYGTSKDFLKTFGLSAVDDLPAVKELKKIYSQREAQRLENEAKKAEERRQREKEEALEREKRYKPPVTELARPLSMEEREQLDAKLKEVDPIIEEQLENELDDDEVAIAEVSPEVEADDDAAAEEPVAAASSSDESDDEETTETVDDTMDVAEEEEDDDDDEYEELVWDDDEDDEEEEFDEGIFDDDDEEDEEK